jgi:D-glycero-beta-D-manno-heptose-7-phosphate kinase
MTSDRLHTILNEAKNRRILVLGDVMLDRFLWGSVTRISPEAPVPIVEITREDAYPGGAANVVRNLIPFCPQVSIVGLTGDDAHADELARLLQQGGVQTDSLIREASYQTIVKTRIMARHQQIVRIDRELRRGLSPEKEKAIIDALIGQVKNYDAVIIEDYGKGFITQNLVDAVVTAARAASVIVTVDPNPTNPLRWSGVTAVKPNRTEAIHAAGLSDHPQLTTEALPVFLSDLSTRLHSLWETELLLITLSEHGMALMPKHGALYHLPTQATEVVDVSGAGDTAIALFTLALAAGATPEEATYISNHSSGIVVGKTGTATLSPADLIDSMTS